MVVSEYKRWGGVSEHYSGEEDEEEETEISLSLEEEEVLRECSGGITGAGNKLRRNSRNSNSNPQVDQTTQLLTLSGCRLQPKRISRSLLIPRKKENWRWKVQLIVISGGILLLGFISGFCFGVRNKPQLISETKSLQNEIVDHFENNLQDKEEDISKKPNIASAPENEEEEDSSGTNNKEKEDDYIFNTVVNQISAENIKINLKRMTQEIHAAGSTEGQKMGSAIRDLWRSFGLSVRQEQHFAKITLSKKRNFLRIYKKDGKEGEILFETNSNEVKSITGNDFVAFSPSTDINGSLIYGNAGGLEDFEYLERSQIDLKGSIALIRLSNDHPAHIAEIAGRFGLKGLVFYPDPRDFGQWIPSTATPSSSIITLNQIQEFSEGKLNLSITAHSINFNDAESLIRMMRGGPKAPRKWQGGLNPSYSIGGILKGHLHTFNELSNNKIFNVIAAIPGSLESDRYVIVGAAHDSWNYGASNPGIGLAILTEIARVFSLSVSNGWKPRRSIMFISFDGHLHGNIGVYKWLKEHKYEIESRTITFIDATQMLEGNRTVNVCLTPSLREVLRKVINRLKSFRFLQMPTFQFSSILSSNEPSIGFFGNLGIPFIRFSASNQPFNFDYSLTNTAFDNYENFEKLVDPNFLLSEIIGKIISGVTFLLADSPILPINISEYVDEIQKASSEFVSEFQEDFHKANLSIGYFQGAIMRIQVIGDNFRTEVHNRSVIVKEEEDILQEKSQDREIKAKRSLFHRIINDKLMNFERAFLSSRDNNYYKHLILGFSHCSNFPNRFNRRSSPPSTFCNYPKYFPNIKKYLSCAKNERLSSSISRDENKWECRGNEWKKLAEVELSELIRSIDAASAVLQSPLLPEESDSSNN